MGYFKGQNSFTGGVISPALWGRVDLAQYMASASILENFIVLPWGGLTRRGGTEYGWPVKDASKTTRLLPFVYNRDDSYILEVGDLYMRFGRLGSQVLDGSGALELSTPWAEDEVNDLVIAQSADTIWFFHKDHVPRKLVRFSEIEWYLTPVSFIDGPYLATNTRSIELQASGSTGTVTVTAASPASISNVVNDGGGQCQVTAVAHGLVSGDTVKITGVGGTTGCNGTWKVTVIDADTFVAIYSNYNGGYTAGGAIGFGLFAVTDVGRLMRQWHAVDALWGWGEITAYNDVDSVTVVIVENKFEGPGATTMWKLGKFSGTTGYPAVGTLHEQRMIMAGAPENTVDIDATQTGILNDFQVAPDLDVTAADAYSYSLFSGQSSPIQWLLPIRGGLGVGTAGAEWIMTGAAGQDDPITPNSINAKDHSAVGSTPIPPVKAGSAALFTSRDKRRIHEFAYLFEDDSYQAPDMSLLAEHLTRKAQIVSMAYQRTERICWCVLDTGELIALTYMREEKVTAWHVHKTDGLFKSICVIPEGDRDVLYAIVERVVNGNTVQYIEWMTDIFRGTEVADGYFVDCGVRIDIDSTSAAVQAISKANPVRVDALRHGLHTGDIVQIDDLTGMDEVEGQQFKVLEIEPDSFQLYAVNSTTLVERIVNSNIGAFTPDGPLGSVNGMSAVDDGVYVVYVGGVDGASYSLGDPINASGPLTDGQKYCVGFRAAGTLSAGITISVVSSVGGVLATTAALDDEIQGYALEFTCDADTNPVINCSGTLAVGEDVTIKNVHLTEILDGEKVDGTAFTTYVSGGIARRKVRIVDGLDHLEGRSVAAVGDGKLIPNKTVVGGMVDFGVYVEDAVVGLNFVSKMVTLPMELPETEAGASLGRTKSINEIIARIYDSFHFKAGLIVNDKTLNIDEAKFNQAQIFNQVPALFTGEKAVTPDSDYGTDVRVIIETDLPSPLNISAIVTEYNLEDE